VVLAWSLQSDTPAGQTRVARRPAVVTRPAAPRGAARTRASVEELAIRPPSADDYSPLLQGNVFQPRVVQRAAPVIHQTSPAATAKARPAASANAVSHAPASTESWHDWKFDGTAQLDQQTYALMDLTNKKESRFVKVGDHLEDAIVERVSENEVALREAGGNLVHVQRVDAMAELMRSVRTAPAARPAAPPAAGATTQGTAAPGTGPTIINPNGQTLPQAAPAVPDNSFQGGRRRRGRRSQQLDDGSQ
jgi:hypothetical protein